MQSMTKAIHRYRRFTGWDYARGASLFITIATEPRRPLFGKIVGGKMVYTPLGRKVIEALLAIDDYWKGVGNIELLSPDEKLVSLRVSREVVSPTAIAQVVHRMERAVDRGYVIISGFISRGERTVKEMLCRRRVKRVFIPDFATLPKRWVTSMTNHEKTE